MLLTLCTIHQLPRAFALASSFCQNNSTSNTTTHNVLIGLADNPDHLPNGFVSPYPLLFLRDILPASRLATLSGQYTPVEFVATCKPLFIAEALRRYPLVNQFVYADPAILFCADTTPIFSALSSANVLLTPHLTRSPTTVSASGKSGNTLLQPDAAGRSRTRPDRTRPEQKYLQNVGLYSSDFMAFRRSDETHRMLAWWQDRVTERAFINFCDGLCLDQIWLMHVPVFFREVVTVRNPGWHVALWNLFERQLQQTETGWYVRDTGAAAQPLLFINTKGLLNADEGLFTQLDQPAIRQRSGVEPLIQHYRSTLTDGKVNRLTTVAPEYGSQPMPVLLRGWRQQIVQLLRAAASFVDRVSLPSVP